MRYCKFFPGGFAGFAFVLLPLLCGTAIGTPENQTVTAFDPSIIYGGSWKTNGSHGINHKASKSGGAFANYTFQGSAIYYTGEISAKASAVEVVIDSVSHGILNISHQARMKGIKPAASDVDILFSATDLDSKEIHTFSLRDYNESEQNDTFLTLYRLTVTTGTSSTSSSQQNQPIETSTMDGMSMYTDSVGVNKPKTLEISLGVSFAVITVAAIGLLVIRRRRTGLYDQTILQSVTPFIVRSHWWRIAAGERLPKLVMAELSTSGLRSSLGSTSFEIRSDIREPPPEYAV